MITPGTLMKVRHLLARSQYQGTELAEVLDREALLLTPARRRELELAVLRGLLRRLQEVTPVELLRLRHRVLEATTQADLYHCMIQFMEQYISRWEQEPR